MSFKTAWKQEQYDKRKHYIDSIKVSSGCSDCKVWGPAEILSFDHVRGIKEFGIGQRWDVAIKRLEEEIAKCEVVCHNCHAIRTARRKCPLPPFVPFPKIPRLSRNCVVTEKIDGTNAIIWIDEDGCAWAGSKNRWISPEEDNYGFASWVEKNEQELVDDLGAGVHIGEWWGAGIQRKYGLKEKRLSLFNVGRWQDQHGTNEGWQTAYPAKAIAPACCYVVPILNVGEFNDSTITSSLAILRSSGSAAVPFMNPEGIVIFHEASGYLFKKTLVGDEKPKSLNA